MSSVTPPRIRQYPGLGSSWWSSSPGEGQGPQGFHLLPSVPAGEGWVPPGVARFLAPGENVILATRRHSVVLFSAVAVWLATQVLGLAAGLASPTHRGFYLGQVGAAVSLAGTLFLISTVW